MNILVTGGNSVLGVYIKEYFSDFAEVITAGRRECDLIWDWEDDPEQWEQPKEKIDLIIHTAASYLSNTFKERNETFRINVLGTLKVGEFAKHTKVDHLIHISSIFAHLDPSSPFFTAYALSKKQAEEALEFHLADSNVKYTILRPSQLFDSKERFRKTQPFFYFILDKCKAGENLEFYGDRSPLRNYLHINDFLEILKRTLNKKIYGSYDCTFPSNISYHAIAEEAYRVYATEGEISYMKDKPNLEDNTFPYASDLYDLIDYIPIINMKRGVEMLSKIQSQ